MDPMMMMMLMQGMQSSKEGGRNFVGNLMSGNGSRPYGNAERAYDRYTSPWSNAGRGAINPFSQRLNEMGNTGDFMKNIMGQYQESPWARNMQNQSMRAGQNAASASGLMGSTPLMNQLQQNAGNISSQDQQNFFNNMMGINDKYMQGQNQLMNFGFGSDQAAAPWMGEQEYNKQSAKDSWMGNLGSSFMQMMGW